jgi:hypothetical protein
MREEGEEEEEEEFEVVTLLVTWRPEGECISV